MTYVGFAVLSIMFGVTLLAILFAARCYGELRSWARQCQQARIIIAYNNRVKMQAPLVEWLLWTRKLSEDERSAGRVVFREQKMSVAIAAPPPKANNRPKLLDAWRTVRAARTRKLAGAPAK